MAYVRWHHIDRRHSERSAPPLMAQILPIQPGRSLQPEGTFTGGAAWPPGRPLGSDEGISAPAFVSLVRRHWIKILSMLAVSLAVAYAVTRFTTPVYRASTTVYFADRQGSMPALDIL